nr:hypothetical protein [Tanacetum cinerariifolium]
MANLSEDIQCTGFDTRPPMLDRTDFSLRQQRIRLYCRGKKNGVNILKSIDEGPYQIGTVRETLAESKEGAPQFGLERPRHKGESTHDYYVRFAKLINDMRNIKMTMSRMQLNSKFVNNMLPEWGRFVIDVKLNRGLRDSNYDQLNTYLKQYETYAKENKMILERFSQNTMDPLALMSNVSNPQRYSPSSSTSSSTQVSQPLTDNPHLDSSLSSAENLIENLTNTLALLTQSYKTFLPQTNNQLRTSSNARNQATVQDGRVVVQNVQGRQNRGQGMNLRGGSAAGYGGAQNRVMNVNPGQARQGQARPMKCYNYNGTGHIARNCTQPKRPQNSEYYKDKMLLMHMNVNPGQARQGQARPMKYYNYNGTGHIARNCTQPKRPQNSEYYKDKMLLMHAQENGVALDAKQLLFLADGQDNAFDDDVDEQPVQELALNIDNVFQADDYDVFDSNVDKAPTAQPMFMANLSSADPITDEARPSYDLDILSEVHNHDYYQDTACAHHEEHMMHDSVQLDHVVDSHADYASDSNMILYDQYVKENEVPVVHSDVSSILNDAFMTIYNDMCEPHTQSVSNPSRNTIVKNSLTTELATYKEQVELLIKQDQSLQTVHMLCSPKPYYNELNKVAIGYKNHLCLTRAKQIEPALYNGHEIIKDNHALAIVHNTEDTLKMAEITKKKMNAKMNGPECVTRKVKIAPHDHSKENFLATFTSQKQLTPKKIFWSNDLIKLKSEALKEQTTVSRPIKAVKPA